MAQQSPKAAGVSTSIQGRSASIAQKSANVNSPSKPRYPDSRKREIREDGVGVVGNACGPSTGGQARRVAGRVAMGGKNGWSRDDGSSAEYICHR